MMMKVSYSAIRAPNAANRRKLPMCQFPPFFARGVRKGMEVGDWSEKWWPDHDVRPDAGNHSPHRPGRDAGCMKLNGF